MRWFPFLQSGKMTGIVLNTGTKAGLTHHFDIKISPFRNPLCLQKLILRPEIPYSVLQLRLNVTDRTLHCFLIHNIMRCRKHNHMLQLGQNLTGQHIDLRDPVHLIAEKFHTDRAVRLRNREYLQHISAHTEGTTLKIHVIPCVLHIDQTVNDLIPILDHARSQ